MIFLVIILGTAVGLGVLFAMIGYSLLWLQRQAGRQFEQKFHDATQIIQAGHPPAAWVQREHEQVKKWRSQNKSAAAIARVGARAKRRCLHQLRVLIHFLENGRFYDSLETRELIVERLWEIHGQWLKDPWEHFTNL